MKDESVRDRAIKKLIAERLRDEGRAATGECPDAEILAAYVERALTPHERLNCETHLASCAGCQGQIAALVRLGEAEQPAEVRQASGTARFSWFAGFRWAWAAPVLVALVISGLWYTGEYRRYTHTPEEKAAKIMAPATEPAAPEQAQEAEPRGVTVPPPRDRAKKEAQGNATGALALSARPELQKAPQALGAEKTLPSSASTSGGTSPSLAEQGAIAPPATRSRLATTAPANQPTDALRANKDEASAAPPPPQSRKEAADAAAAPVLAPPSRTAPAVVSGNLRPEKSRERYEVKMKAGAPSSAAQVAPAVAPELSSFSLAKPAGRSVAAAQEGGWRVGARGLIQKVGPDGRWITQPSGVDVDLFAITFPTPRVGWAVGQGGTVLRTTDGGSTWLRCERPTSEDLMRVSGLEESTARVETRTGRVLVTIDGGKTWTEERR